MHNLRTKVIVSLGPSTRSEEIIIELAKLGVSGFRINFAHGEPKEWDFYVKAVRHAEEITGKPLALIGDLRGSSIRIGELDSEVRVSRGESVRFVLSSRGGGKDEVPLPNPKVFESVDVGDVIVMDDGKVRLRISEVGPDYIVATALTDAVIRSRKTLVVKDREFDLPVLTSKDIEDIKYACSRGFDYLGLSYVRTPEDVRLLKDYMRELGCNARVIAKIETRQALRNLESIVAEADVVLVARGDLGMCFGIEEIPRIQKRIVMTSRRLGKPVILATQLLESMIEKQVPTRSEVVDISVAISEGVDALMLTGETSIGKYPVEAASWLVKIVRTTEEYVRPEYVPPIENIKVMYAKGVVELAKYLKGKIVIYSMKGTTAIFIASLRPSVDTYVGVPSIEVARKLSILWGINPIVINAKNYDEGLEKTYSELLGKGLIRIGDLVVLTYGLRGDEQIIKVRRVLE